MYTNPCSADVGVIIYVLVTDGCDTSTMRKEIILELQRGDGLDTLVTTLCIVRMDSPLAFHWVVDIYYKQVYRLG